MLNLYDPGDKPIRVGGAAHGAETRTDQSDKPRITFWSLEWRDGEPRLRRLTWT